MNTYRRRKKCLINLDTIFNAKNCKSSVLWHEGVFMKDMSKTSQSPKTSPRSSKRKNKGQISSRLAADHIVDKPSGYCPGCAVYVKAEDDGVECTPCAAFWHMKCAGVTPSEIDQLGDNLFYCMRHGDNAKTKVNKDTFCANSHNDGPSQCVSQDEPDAVLIQENKMDDYESNRLSITPYVESSDMKCVEAKIEDMELKVASYVLNEEASKKFKLDNLVSKYDIQLKDNGKQYVIVTNTVTYHIIMQNLIVIGQNLGLKVKLNEVDSNGIGTKQQYNGTILISNEVMVPVTLICYHTKNKFQIQLLGKKSSSDWDEKLDALHHFVYDLSLIHI